MSRAVERRGLGYDRPMRRAGYQLLGYAVWRLIVRSLRQRGPAPKKLAAGAVLAAVAVALVLAVRRGGDDGDV